MEMGRFFFSPHLFPERGQWDFYLSCHCSGLLPVLKLGGRAGISWCPPFFLPPDLPVTTKLPQGPQARLRWQLCLLHRTQRFPQAPPQHCSLGWVGVAGSPRSHTRASSAASSLPPAWHPSPLSLRSSIYLSLNTMQLCTFA